MPSLLVHVTCGPEAHEVSVFFAADGVQLLRAAVLDSLVGLGTGSLREHFDAVVAGGGKVFASKMSAAARGVGEDQLSAAGAQPAPPTTLVRLTFDSDRVLVY